MLEIHLQDSVIHVIKKGKMKTEKLHGKLNSVKFRTNK